jgi:hypothetical protein
MWYLFGFEDGYLMNASCLFESDIFELIAALVCVNIKSMIQKLAKNGTNMLVSLGE